MGPWIRSHLTFANVVSLMALFVALGGTATAVSYVVSSNSQVGPGTISGHNPPAGAHKNILPGSVNAFDLASGAINTRTLDSSAVTHGKLAPNAVNGANVHDNSLSGADVDESTLGTVPSATLGGLGRWTGSSLQQDLCDPNSDTFIPCATTNVNLPKPSRLLVIGRVVASTGGAAANGFGQCRIGTTSGPLTASTTSANVPGIANGFVETDNLSVVGVTDVLPAGSNGLDIDCNQTGGAISYRGSAVAAVGISPD